MGLTFPWKTEDSSSTRRAMFKCTHCEKTFSRYDNLRRHVTIYHPDEQVPDRISKRNDADAPFGCDCCEKRFFKRFLLRRHVKLMHIGQPLPSLTRVSKKTAKKPKPSSSSNNLATDAKTESFPCSNCTKVFLYRGTLKRHIKTEHPEVPAMPDKRNKRFESEYPNRTYFQYNNLSEFEEWKYQEEVKTSTWHVKCNMISKKTKSAKPGCKYAMYRCHCSGVYKPKGSGKRRMKPSCKIGSLCPASIHIKVFPDGKVTGWYNNKHVEHKRDIGHRFVRKKDKERISELLAAGMSLDDVLVQVRSWAVDSLSPFHIITRKDLHNICREFHIIKRHETVKHPENKQKKKRATKDKKPPPPPTKEERIGRLNELWNSLVSSMWENPSLLDAAEVKLSELSASMTIVNNLPNVPVEPVNNSNESVYLLSSHHAQLSIPSGTHILRPNVPSTVGNGVSVVFRPAERVVTSIPFDGWAYSNYF